MRVELAKTCRLLPGSSGRFQMVDTAARSGSKTVTYGPIIHNIHVVERFAAMGVEEIDHYDQAEPGTIDDHPVHGVSREVYEGLERRAP